MQKAEPIVPTCVLYLGAKLGIVYWIGRGSLNQMIKFNHSLIRCMGFYEGSDN